MYDNTRSTNHRPAFRPDANPGDYAQQNSPRAGRQRTRIVRSGDSVYSRQAGSSSYHQPGESRYSRVSTDHPFGSGRREGGTSYGNRYEGGAAYGNRRPAQGQRQQHGHDVRSAVRSGRRARNICDSRPHSRRTKTPCRRNKGPGPL